MSQVLISPARVSLKIIRPDCLCRSGTRLGTRGWSQELSSGPDQTSTSTEASPTSTNLTTGKTLCSGSGCAPSLTNSQRTVRHSAEKLVQIDSDVWRWDFCAHSDADIVLWFVTCSPELFKKSIQLHISLLEINMEKPQRSVVCWRSPDFKKNSLWR